MRCAKGFAFIQFVQIKWLLCLRTFLPARYVLLLITLFFVPGLVMIVAYGLISRELYRGIQFEMDLSREAKGAYKGKEAGNRSPLGWSLALMKKQAEVKEAFYWEK